MRKDYKKSLKDKGELFNFFEKNKYLLGDRQYAEKYYAQTTCKVTYNRNGYISFKYSSKWYEGGAYNTWDYGTTYRLRDGKKIGIQDVISGNISTYGRK